jgi:hypothetical protein
MPNPNEVKNILLEKAEENLKSLLSEYRRGETEHFSEKYLDELRNEIEVAKSIVDFISFNS